MPRRKAPSSLRGRPGQKCALGLRTTAQRKLERGKLGSLRSCLVLPSTLRAYTAACIWFFGFVVAMGLDLGDEVWELDIVVGDAIEYAWDTGLSRALIGNVLSGLEHFVNPLRGQLKESWRLWKLWGQKEVPSRAPPLSASATLAICWYMWVWGYPEAALLTCLGFHRFMRTMEFLSLTAGQLSFGRGKLHISLPASKGARRRGSVEGVTLSDRKLCRLLRLLCSSLLPGDSLLPITVRQYRALFDAAVSALGLSNEFKPYSLRRGGASHFFRHTGNWAMTMEVGRWGNIHTAKTYVNVALLELTAMQRLESDNILAAADSFLKHIVLKEWTTWSAAAGLA